jgi:hypothetical protein
MALKGHMIFIFPSSRALSKSEEETLIEAVRATGRVVGGTCKFSSW